MARFEEAAVRVWMNLLHVIKYYRIETNVLSNVTKT